MIGKVVIFMSCLAVAYSTAILGSGVISPGLLNAGIIAPGHVNSRIIAPVVFKSGLSGPGILKTGYVSTGLAFNDVPVIAAPVAALAPSAFTSNSVDARPDSIPTDGRVIGTAGVLVGTHLVNSGLLGASPIALNRGMLSAMGLKNTGILAGPGTIKTVLK